MNQRAQIESEGKRLAGILRPVRTLKEVSVIFGITPERVRQIENHAMGVLAFRLRQLLEVERMTRAGELPETAPGAFLDQIREEAAAKASKRSINEARRSSRAFKTESGTIGTEENPQNQVQLV